MQAYKNEFIDLALELGVLKFGEFTLKSGRTSPYFFNAGLFNTGYAAARLGRYYAQTVAKSGIEAGASWLVPLGLAVLVGGQIGSRLSARRLPLAALQRVTGCLVLFVAVRVLWVER